MDDDCEWPDGQAYENLNQALELTSWDPPSRAEVGSYLARNLDFGGCSGGCTLVRNIAIGLGVATIALVVVATSPAWVTIVIGGAAVTVATS